MAKTLEELLAIRRQAVKTIRQMQLRCMIIDAGITGNQAMLEEIGSNQELMREFKALEDMGNVPEAVLN